MSQSTRIKTLKKSMAFRQLDLCCLEPGLVAVDSRQWNKNLSNCCTWSSLKESAVRIIYNNNTKPRLQYPSVYISQLFFLHQHVYFENTLLTNQTLLHCFKTEIEVSLSFNHKWYPNVLKPDKIWTKCMKDVLIASFKNFPEGLFIVFYCF